MVERTRAAFGRIDVLVNNAGIYRAALPLDITEEHWDAVMNINAKAVFFASQAVLPTMIAQKRGAIVSLASMAGKVGSRTNLPYNASKAAVISITKSLALAHAADGIRVNCVCPGFVETDMELVSREQGALLGVSPEDFTEQRAAQVPLGRMEQPEDVAKVIGFLASDRAGYMTGQAINVTGGLIHALSPYCSALRNDDNFDRVIDALAHDPKRLRNVLSRGNSWVTRSALQPPLGRQRDSAFDIVTTLATGGVDGDIASDHVAQVQGHWLWVEGHHEYFAAALGHLRTLLRGLHGARALDGQVDLRDRRSVPE